MKDRRNCYDIGHRSHKNDSQTRDRHRKARPTKASIRTASGELPTMYEELDNIFGLGEISIKKKVLVAIIIDDVILEMNVMSKYRFKLDLIKELYELEENS